MATFASQLFDPTFAAKKPKNVVYLGLPRYGWDVRTCSQVPMPVSHLGLSMTPTHLSWCATATSKLNTCNRRINQCYRTIVRVNNYSEYQVLNDREIYAYVVLVLEYQVALWVRLPVVQVV